MLKKIFSALAISCCLMAPLKILAESPPTQWQLLTMKEASLYKLIYEEHGKIISTTSISWPDGRSALVTYVQTEKNLFRCIDCKNKDFTDSGYICAHLINPEAKNNSTKSQENSRQFNTPPPTNRIVPPSPKKF